VIVFELGEVLMRRSLEFGVFSIIVRLAFTLAMIWGISAMYRAKEMASNRQTPETAAAPDAG
jgi:hypothetical protein